MAVKGLFTLSVFCTHHLLKLGIVCKVFNCLHVVGDLK